MNVSNVFKLKSIAGGVYVRLLTLLKFICILTKLDGAADILLGIQHYYKVSASSA